MSVRWDWWLVMLRFMMWLLMSSVREWFLDDWIAGNAWFLWVKLGWDGCFVLSNMYWFFKDFDWVRLKPYFTRVWGDFWVIWGDFWWCWNGEKHWFFKVLSNSVSKWILEWVWGENARKCLFYKGFVDGTDMPFLAIEHLF